MAQLIANMDMSSDELNQASAKTDTVKTAARHALSKAELDLQLTSCSSASVLSRALVQNELHTVLTQLTDQRNRTCSEENRQQTAERLWQSTVHGLIDRQDIILSAIELYRSKKLAEIGNLFQKKHSRSVDDAVPGTTNVMAIQAFDRKLLQAEFTAMFEKFVDSYLADRSCVEKTLQQEEGTVHVRSDAALQAIK